MNWLKRTWKNLRLRWWAWKIRRVTKGMERASVRVGLLAGEWMRHERGRWEPNLGEQVTAPIACEGTGTVTITVGPFDDESPRFRRRKETN